ncbi:DNA polymerase lambda isoform X4 [Dioscorea cayenensis subsp. rotundata]|uniref:DNA polymerase n=1 Tax=Dioscorea cayennensis subsp. rotundata TaxID=55577 RepID=A0AB40ANE0_DIOCR|nr:DNA polymerase lambda isoform X4 [Dioscorea cayenensis subsp. rotundata]
MAPRAAKSKRQASPSIDPHGIFRGMVVFLCPTGIQPRRLQIWKQKLLQMGAVVDDGVGKRTTHILAANSSSLLEVDRDYLKQFEGVQISFGTSPKVIKRERYIKVLGLNCLDSRHKAQSAGSSACLSEKLLLYAWLENCLHSGKRISEDPYILKFEPDGSDKSAGILEEMQLESPEACSSDEDSFSHKRIKVSCEDSKPVGTEGSVDNQDSTYKGDLKNKDDDNKSTLYRPPDLNRNITEIFGKLIDIYRALGEDRRSFSYHKAIPVIEKLPYKIESVDQVKHLPTIGKSMQDHINEIVTTGKLSKLEHFEKDEKVRAITLFGEVWGIGPATALKLYEKGHRTLDDLKNDDSLINSQRIGLQFFHDIKKRIPRHEVREMEMLLQKAGEQVLSGVMIVCGGSYRRGKSSCGDLDIIITHPDGDSHKGFLPRYVQHLKDMNFLREDLIFTTHSTEGTDSGVDTYFGLCTYPGREQRHRIDLKVYPRSIYAFGLIAWTGNDVLNRRLRLLAESKGYRLDDTGLFLAAQGSAGKRGPKSRVSVSCSTEKEVFDALGFPWLEPHERNL